VEEKVIAVGDLPEAAVAGAAGEYPSVRMALPVWDETVCLRAVLADPEARLSDLVPLARAAATGVALSVLRQLARHDVAVPCGKGRAACCRYLIPLAPPEAFRLVDELRQLPLPRQARLAKAFAAAERRLRSVSPPSLDPAPGPHGEADAGEMARIGRWYDALDLDCPLLEHELFSCYEWRPVSCRSYIVNSSADYCRPPLTALGTRVGMPVSLTRALCELTARLEGGVVQAVLLPAAPTWAARNWHRARRTWPAREMVELLADILRDQAASRAGSRAA